MWSEAIRNESNYENTSFEDKKLYNKRWTLKEETDL